MQTSRFTPNYLNTNYVPSDPEVKEIKHLLEESDGQLTHLNDALRSMQLAIDGVLRERNKIQDAMDAHRALISYPRRLPNELWQEIFIRTLPSDRNAVMSSSESPILLSHISSAWRRIALSTPQLWATIHISLQSKTSSSHLEHKYTYEKLLQRREVAEMWLSRSGDFPLSISLAEPFLHGRLEYNVHLCVPMIQGLMQFSYRWKHINFHLSSGSIAELATLSAEELPMLESILVRDTTPRMTVSGPGGVWDSPDLFRAPGLKAVNLHVMGGDLLEFPLRWAQLTELWIEGHGRASNFHWVLLPHTALEVLARCPNLVRCCLDMNTPPRFVGPIVPPAEEAVKVVSMPSLTTLSVWEGQNMQSFFQHIHVPKLRHFEYRCMDIPHVSTFLFEPRPGLVSLILDIFDIPEDLLIHCLVNAPMITRLTIAQWANGRTMKLSQVFDLFSFGDNVLRYLTPNAETLESCLCPHLEVFECYQNDFSDLLLLDFIVARSKFGRLKHVDIAFIRDKTFDILPGLSSIIEDGMYISLSYLETPSYSPWNGLPARRWWLADRWPRPRSDTNEQWPPTTLRSAITYHHH